MVQLGKTKIFPEFQVGTIAHPGIIVGFPAEEERMCWRLLKALPSALCPAFLSSPGPAVVLPCPQDPWGPSTGAGGKLGTTFLPSARRGPPPGWRCVKAKATRPFLSRGTLTLRTKGIGSSDSLEKTTLVCYSLMIMHKSKFKRQKRVKSPKCFPTPVSQVCSEATVLPASPFREISARRSRPTDSPAPTVCAVVVLCGAPAPEFWT